MGPSTPKRPRSDDRPNRRRTSRAGLTCTIALLLAASASTADGATTTTAPVAPDITIVLGRPTDRTIAVSVQSAVDADAYVEAGLSASKLTVRSVAQPLRSTVPVDFELTGLQPDRTYTYRVRSRRSGTSAYAASSLHRFHTARPPGSTFTFTIDADPHNRDPRFVGDQYRTTLRNAVAAGPDFHVNLGDTFMTEKGRPTTTSAAAATFADMRPYLGVIGADAPLFLVNGNHEAELGWLFATPAQDELPVWAAQLRRTYYPVPSPSATGFYTGVDGRSPHRRATRRLLRVAMG